MKYTLEVFEEQAEIIKIALEEYFRLRMNQAWDFADDICFDGFNYEKHTKEEFNELIEHRNMFRSEFEKLLNLVHPLQIRGKKYRKQTMEMLRAQDIWRVIRYKLWIDRHGDGDSWCVDARKSTCMSGEPLPKMRRI